MQQTINIQMTEKDQLNVGAKLETSGNYGAPQLMFDYRRSMAADSFLELDYRLGAVNKFGVGMFKRLTNRCNARLKGIFRYKYGSLTPILVASLDYQLDSNLIGRLEFKNEISDRENAFSSMCSSLIYQSNDYFVSLRFQLSPQNPFADLMMEKHFSSYDFRLKSSVNLSYMGLTLSYGVEKQVSKLSKVTTSIALSSQMGVFLNIE